jgi:E3 ubiquitin-protein ligase HUWE1
MLVDLYYNFETVLQINKEKRSNNPTALMSEMIHDHSCYLQILTVLQNHIKRLNEAISYEMEHFFSDKKISINEYSKPLPENVLFKMIKLVNEINKVIYSEDKREGDESDTKKNELGSFIKTINVELLKVWQNLDTLLYEISKIMKEDQKVIDPKLNRLIPYLEAFITLSHLQFLPEKSQTVVNTFIMEDAYKRTPRKTPTIDRIFGNDNIIDKGFNEFFYAFCDRNKKVINLILRRYPKMFPNELLIKISNFLDLENKKKYFKYEIKKLKSERSHITLRVRRNYLFEDSFNILKNKKPEEVRGKLTIKFDGEDAVDAGGVKREWFTLLSKEIFNPNFCLFKLAANSSTYMPNSESGLFDENHLEYFKFIGRVIGKAIYDGFILECYFTRCFYKLLCNISLTYHDMEDVDPEYYKNLKWLLETDITEMGDLLTFSYEEDKFGELVTKDLIENGRNISVTEENKFEYVQKVCHAKLFDSIKPQIESLQKGLYDIIPLKLISIFDHREIELVISGLPTIDSNIY